MPWTFLVVDDNEADLDATAASLLRMGPGASVLKAASGEAALRLLEEKRLVPSLIFLDYQLPGMNGISFLGELRTRRWLERAPVAILSDPMPDRLVVSCYRLGAAACLAKPASQFELREIVREHARPAQTMAAATTIPGETLGQMLRRSAA